jgi:hypothetical protein
VGSVIPSFRSTTFVIPTKGRNLLVAGTVALQTTADSSTA